jgi:hypothetical protein
MSQTFSVADLQARGWTRSMIDRFLGAEDAREPVDHWANYSGKSVWYQYRVEAAEVTPEFEEAFLKSAKRRKLADEQVKSVQRRLKSLRKSGPTPPPVLTKEEKRREDLIRKAAEALEDAIRMGLRTPHKVRPRPASPNRQSPK